LKIQLIEAEHLPTAKNEVVRNDRGITGYIKQGVQFNPMNERVAYHVLRDHPGELHKVFPTTETVAIPADSVQHVYEMGCPGQVRGITWYAPVLVKLWELSSYDNSELTRKNLTTMLVGWIKRTNNTAEQAGIRATSDPTEAGVSGVQEQPGIAFSNIEPGTILDVGEDAELDFYAPPDVGQMYPDFMRIQLLSLAAGMRIPYYVLTGDLTSVSFSSIRAGLIEFRRKGQMIQHHIIVYQFCRPIWNAFIQTCGLVGLLDANEIAAYPEYFEAAWKPQKGEWVDPLKDIEAELLAIRSGLKSRTTAVDEMGEDAEEIDEQQKIDNDRADALGLKYDSDGRNPKNGAQPAQADPARQDKQLETHLL
jgi:lambda family phage portal protein